jgi:hypothetical protein
MGEMRLNEGNFVFLHAAYRFHRPFEHAGTPGEGLLLQMASSGSNFGSVSRSFGGCQMDAMRVAGFVLAALSAIPVFILFRVFGSLRRELSEARIREPELTLQVLSGFGGARGLLFFAGWILALIGGMLLGMFA